MRRSSSASAQSMARSRAIFARSNRIRMRARFCRSASGTWVRTLRSSTCTAWGGPYTVPERRRLTNACSRPTSQSSNLHTQICRLSGGRLMRGVSRQGNIMTVKRMDNVGIVVEDIDAAIEFFTELGLELEGRAPIEGDWADGVTGLRDMRVEIAMMHTPDGHGRLDISPFSAPPGVADHRSAPVNALGYLRVMFTVEDIDDTLARLGKRGAELVGEVVQYEDTYRLCYIRGPEGILIGLAQELGQQTSR